MVRRRRLTTIRRTGSGGRNPAAGSDSMTSGSVLRIPQTCSARSMRAAVPRATGPASGEMTAWIPSATRPNTVPSFRTVQCAGLDPLGAPVAEGVAQEQPVIPGQANSAAAGVDRQQPELALCAETGAFFLPEWPGQAGVGRNRYDTPADNSHLLGEHAVGQDQVARANLLPGAGQVQGRPRRDLEDGTLLHTRARWRARCVPARASGRRAAPAPSRRHGSHECRTRCRACRGVVRARPMSMACRVSGSSWPVPTGGCRPRRRP